MALAVEKACNAPSKFKFLYELSDHIEKKIETIAKIIYGADGIELSELAQEAINRYKKQGFDDMPICMAKTCLSLSADRDIKGLYIVVGHTVSISLFLTNLLRLSIF